MFKEKAMNLARHTSNGSRPISVAGKIDRPIQASFHALICIALFGLSQSACTTKPEVSGPDGRPCVIGFVDSELAMLLRATHPRWELKAGDQIWTPECAGQFSRDILNETFELTR